MRYNISKSRYCNGIQCHKMLWLKKNKPDEFDETCMSQSVLESGLAVGDLAMGLFGEFVEVPFGDLGEMIKTTTRLMAENTPIIAEASFSVDGLFCSVDILKRIDETTVELFEVKSSTSVHDIYYQDAAFQSYILKKLGYDVKSCNIVHINNQYVRKGELDIHELFTIADITDDALLLGQDVASNVADIREYMQQTSEPDDDIGEHCFSPYTCGFFGYCTRNLPKPTTRDQRMMCATVTMAHMADSKEQLDADTETILSTARRHLCQLAVLKFQQTDGLNTVLPIGCKKIQATRTLTTENLAVFMPFKVQEVAHEHGIYYGQNAISNNMIIANRKWLLNGNSFILGVSGSGKSVTGKCEIANLMLAGNSDIIIIDPEREYAPLVKAMGGAIIDISATSKNHINAMDMNSDYGDGEDPLILKSEFILSLCEQLIGSRSLGAQEKSLIDRCAKNVYRNYRRRGYKGKVPTLKDFRADLLKQSEPEAQEIALAIELFTDGSLNTFAKETNVDVNNRLICYDILDLGKQLLPIGMLVVLDSILNRITANRAKGKNTFIIIDEIYLLFQHEYSANFLFTLWKRVRKYGAFCTGITQNVDDLLQSHTARTMLANSEFVIMLNQASTDRIKLAELLNISDTQLSYITNVEAGRGLMKVGSALVPFVNKFPKNTKLYALMTTKFGER